MTDNVIDSDTSLTYILEFGHHCFISGKVAIGFLIDDDRALTAKLKDARDQVI